MTAITVSTQGKYMLFYSTSKHFPTPSFLIPRKKYPIVFLCLSLSLRASSRLRMYYTFRWIDVTSSKVHATQCFLSFFLAHLVISSQFAGTQLTNSLLCKNRDHDIWGRNCVYSCDFYKSTRRSASRQRHNNGARTQCVLCITPKNYTLHVFHTH